MRSRAGIAALAVGVAALAPAGAEAKGGNLKQLRGAGGCLVDSSRPAGNCGSARALRGPGPFLGSRAIAISPDGENVYVASSGSDAIAVFERDGDSGELTQRSGSRGCISAGGSDGCRTAVGLDGPNSVAVSPDGENVYATSFDSDSVTSFDRDEKSGALRQTAAGGCLAEGGASGCAAARALDGADVVVASPDGEHVYAGAFTGGAVAVFARQPGGGLVQPPGPDGCITAAPDPACAAGFSLLAPEGLAVSGDGRNVYAAAAGSNAIDVFARDPATGALSQATDGTGCIANSERTGCATGRQLEGPNAVAVSPDDGEVYVTSLFSDSVTSFARNRSTGSLSQLEGTEGCMVWLLAVGCSLGQAMNAPEGLAPSDDGRNLYIAAFDSGAVDVIDRDAGSGTVVQKPGKGGCAAVRTTRNCTLARQLRAPGAVVVSPDGANVYATAFASDAVAVFTRSVPSG